MLYKNTLARLCSLRLQRGECVVCFLCLGVRGNYAEENQTDERAT